MAMTRTTATFSISLPPNMAAELERVRKQEHRTRSELVREALRRYMHEAQTRVLQNRIAALPEETPDADERAAIAEGGRELKRGAHISLSRLQHELHRPRQQSRTKKP
jgi:Arc/MetJ-type ribon-helix-helix transcriptional regulator